MANGLESWLKKHRLGQYAEVFSDNEIDLEAAADLNADDLRELGIAMGPRKKLLRAIGKLASGEPAIPENAKKR